MCVPETVVVKALEIYNFSGDTIWFSDPNGTMAPFCCCVRLNFFDHAQCNICIKLLFDFFLPVDRY